MRLQELPICRGNLLIMDIGRLRRSDRIVGLGAVALLVFLFVFKWYGVSSSSSVGGASFSASDNGWHTFTNSRWLWLVTIVVALAVVWAKAAQRELTLPVQPGVLVAGLGALSTIFILYRIIDHPTAGASETVAGVHISLSAGIKIGIWLGLIAAGAITYGGYLTMQDEGTSLSDVREQAGEAFSGLTRASSEPAGEAASPAAAGAPAPTPSAPPLPTPSAPAPPTPPADPEPPGGPADGAAPSSS
jgi:hypothetical protein